MIFGIGFPISGNGIETGVIVPDAQVSVCQGYPVDVALVIYFSDIFGYDLFYTAAIRVLRR